MRHLAVLILLAAPAAAAAPQIALPTLTPPVDFAKVAAGPPLAAGALAAVPCKTIPGATYRAVGRVAVPPERGVDLVVFEEQTQSLTRRRLMIVSTEHGGCAGEIDVLRRGHGDDLSATFTKHANIKRIVTNAEGKLQEVRSFDNDGNTPLIDGLETFNAASFKKTDKAWMKSYLRELFGDGKRGVALDGVTREKGHWRHGGCDTIGWVTLYLAPEAGNTLHAGHDALFPAVETSYEDTFEAEVTALDVADHGRTLRFSQKPFPGDTGVTTPLTATHDPGLQLWLFNFGSAHRMPARAAAVLPKSAAVCESEEGP